VIEDPLKTFMPFKEMVDNPDFHLQKKRCLSGLNNDTLDPPIATIVTGFNNMSFCFTLQSCCGHFLSGKQQDARNVKRLPESERSIEVHYRIAYLALCVENIRKGLQLIDNLRDCVNIDRQYIQFGCAQWFWKQQVNTYVLQVEPERYKTWDHVRIPYGEALHIQKVRETFFVRLERIIQKFSLNV
jgi:hypothetical protein